MGPASGGLALDDLRTKFSKEVQLEGTPWSGQAV